MTLRPLCPILIAAVSVFSWSQTATTTAGSSAHAPNARPSISFQDALQRAKINSAQFRAALTQSGLAREDSVQARAALLPNVNYTTGAIYTQPTRESTPRYIAANGVREYISQGNVHQSIGFTTVADYRRAHAAEAFARARAEIAARGLVLTVTQNYYGAIASQRKRENAEQAANEANHFLTLSQQLEKGGEVAHSDVIKAQLQANDRQRDLQEARLAEEKSRLDLAVLVFPTFTEEFDLVDDLRFAVPLPQFTEAEALAAKNNAELEAALAAVQVANNEYQAAVGGHLPTLTLDYFYGIDAPTYATYTNGVRNLGYQMAATLQLPVFNWGATQSKVRQAKLQRTQAQVELSAAQRQALADLRMFYAEASTAKEQIETLRQSEALAADSLRLTTLRYRSGEATALEVVDAQNSLAQARNDFDDGEVRYRVALANLQTLTGTF
ncbi:MAG TPA: TolC family protein [Candidatus Acidoferrales bacterium]|nr:TolC family protein [Candidatus Acidoferrales bacterium]